jgi:hypothetical protein
MKTSNTILLVLLLLSTLLIAAMPVTFKYKINKKNYVLARPGEAFAYNRHIFSGVNYFKITGISNCTIVPFDSVIAEVPKANTESISLRKTGDTLVIIGDPKLTRLQMRLLLPDNSNIQVSQSQVLLKGEPFRLEAKSYQIELDSSRLFTQLLFSGDIPQQFFNTLSVTGKAMSQVHLYGNAQIKKLSLTDVGELICIKCGFEDSDFKFYHKQKVSSIGTQDTLKVNPR